MSLAEINPEVGAAPLADQTIAQIGARIRVLRQRRNLTLKALAAETGLSVSMLSMLERGVASASVGTLVSVTSALGIHMHELFDRPDATRASPVVRKSDQALAITSEGTTRRIAHYDAQAGVELAVNTYAPGGSSSPTATHHRGRELGVVLSGSLRIEVDGDTYVLDPGDAVAYASTKRHRISNDGTTECVAVWVNLDLT